MKTTTVLILTISTLLFATGCKRDRAKCPPPKKPTSEETHKVPDAPSGLQLSAIAAAAIAAYWVTARKEKTA